MNKTVLSSFIITILLQGCYNIKYSPHCQNIPKPTEHAVAFDGDMGNSDEIAKKIVLPHISLQDKLLLAIDFDYQFVTQLNSRDYFIMGFISGGGNAYQNLAGLKKEMLTLVAQKGGDVLLFYNSGHTAQDYSYTTPGYATTNIYGSAYGGHGYTTGHATANTTYMPPQSYSGTRYFPYAHGMVLKYDPEVEITRQRLRTLDEAALTEYVAEGRKLCADTQITSAEAGQRRRELLDRLTELGPK